MIGTMAHGPTPMVFRNSHFGGNRVAECPECHRLCGYWDEEDLSDEGELICWGGEQAE